MRLLAPSRGTHTYWAAKDPVIYEGVIGLTKDRLFNGSLEYFIGDGVHKYSELPKYGGAEASSTKKNNTLVLRNGNGKIDSASLPDATASAAGAVKASTTKAVDTVVKADANGSLDGWKDAIVGTIENENGGLVVDPNTGDLMVDFSQMPTDKFEALLKGLKMLIPMTTDMSFYVNQEHANASDNTADIVVGDVTHKRGEEAYPFRTIQACVNYVTETYSVGPRNPKIYVVNGVNETPYNERVVLPFYNRTSGSISLRAADYSNPPTIIFNGTAGTCLDAVGGVWSVYRLSFEATFSDPKNGNINIGAAIGASGSGTTLYLYGCSLSIEYDDDAPISYFGVRLLGAYANSNIILGVLAGYQHTFHCVKGNATAAAFLFCERSGKITITSSNIADDNICYDMPCSGSVTSFAQVSSRSIIDTRGGGNHWLQFSGTVAGKKYAITGGSTVTVPSNGLPGDEAGTVDSATYCWYAE